MESLLTPYTASDVPNVKSVLALAPHPDDEVFGCGGALALHVEAGCSVHVLIATSGDAGGDASVRREESLKAAAELGYPAPDFWGLPDRGLLYGEALVQRILRSISFCDAQLVYAPSLWENHPDHRALAMAALEAVRRHGRCVLMAYEVGAPLRPNRLISIASVIAKKRAAMACFPSQLAGQNYDRQIEALNVFRSYTLRDGSQWAEAFECIDADALQRGLVPFLQSEHQRQLGQGLIQLPQDAQLVSVLIRSMDRPELARALDSIAAQTWPAVEVVVVNAKGGLHSAVSQWCGRFPVRFVDSERALPRSEAANRAMDSAQGHAMVFLDDDDYFAPDHLHRLASALATRPDAVAAVTGAQAIGPDNNLIYEWRGELAPHRLLLFNQMPIMAVLFRCDPVKAGEVRFDESLDLFEDWDFWIQMSLVGPFVEVPGASASYVMNPQLGSGVNLPDKAKDALVPIRAKWRGRWPDAWLDGLRTDFDRIAPLQAEVASTSRILAQQQLDIQRLSEELQRAQQNFMRAEQHNATMDHHRNVAEHYRALAEQSRAVAEQQRDAAEQQRDATEQSLRLTETRCAQIEHEKNKAVHDAREMVIALANQQQSLQALLASRSWRMSAPLRAAGKLARKLLGR